VGHLQLSLDDAREMIWQELPEGLPNLGICLRQIGQSEFHARGDMTHPSDHKASFRVLMPVDKAVYAGKAKVPYPVFEWPCRNNLPSYGLDYSCAFERRKQASIHRIRCEHDVLCSDVPQACEHSNPILVHSLELPHLRVGFNLRSKVIGSLG
jgi:hypothetical protein